MYKIRPLPASSSNRYLSLASLRTARLHKSSAGTANLYGNLGIKLIIWVYDVLCMLFIDAAPRGLEDIPVEAEPEELVLCDVEVLVARKESVDRKVLDMAVLLSNWEALDGVEVLDGGERLIKTWVLLVDNYWRGRRKRMHASVCLRSTTIRQIGDIARCFGAIVIEKEQLLDELWVDVLEVDVLEVLSLFEQLFPT
ncbi:hypothetical protein BDQ12DRAFT_665641 [Crucibulum laeve]|uniref:Uncharacterized protein n=1 Tax=Crucibulum laeve TaxID=68775 RepID=A0A5C3M647_9AGAR|nr:hypothetical protein BDQ12DRAFT_665641 [Crucibulum laeve]